MSSALPQEETVEANAQAGIPRGRFQRTFSALRYRDFRLLWFGAFASTTGTFMQTLAQGWLVYKITGVLFQHGFNIESNHEFVDSAASQFFMRTAFSK